MNRVLIFLLWFLNTHALAKDTVPLDSGSSDPWVTSKECWSDGSVDDCAGKLVERRARLKDGFPKYVEFWDASGSLVGLAVNTPYPVMQCDKLDERFACEFRALNLKTSTTIKAGREFQSAEAMAKAIGLPLTEIEALKLDWEVMRVVTNRGGDSPLRLSIPLENTTKERRRATLKATQKEKGTAVYFYAVPRLFKLNR